MVITVKHLIWATQNPMMTSSNGNIFRSPVNSPHKNQWRGALMFSLICVEKKDWVNNGEAGDLRRYLAHYDVTVMPKLKCFSSRLVVVFAQSLEARC